MSQKSPAIVLLADRTLSASYKVLFEGIFATMQTSMVPSFIEKTLLSPKVKTDNSGRAFLAPLGLRRVESALTADGEFSPRDVCVTTPERLRDVVGKDTRIIGLSSSDPLGQGMSNTTTSRFWGGELYTRRWTRETLGQIAQLKARYGLAVVGGGAGAWQWENYGDETKTLDVIYLGYFESQGPKLFRDLIDGKSAPGVVKEKSSCVAGIKPITFASTMGVLELSRGCGKGCTFCSMSGIKMEHLSPELICRDLETNVKHGVKAVVSGSEDFFRYGSKGSTPNFEALEKLLMSMKQVKGLDFMQIDHANVSSVAQMSDSQLLRIRELLSWEKESRYLWVNMGAESVSGSLVKANCPGKLSPYRAEDWEGLLYQTAERMTAAGYFSVFSLVLGLPGETEADVEKTLKFVSFLRTQNAVVFPVFYEPLQIDKHEQRFTRDRLTGKWLELFSSCYEINFRQIPKLYWDNQKCGSVSWGKRALLQFLGKFETMNWRIAFRRLGAK